MNNDTIKLLNLEHIDIDFNNSNIIKKDNTIIATIVLNKQNNIHCVNCGSTDVITKDYYTKSITHSVTTDKPCILKYKARRYVCKDCGTTFYEYNPFCQKDDKLSYLTEALILDKLHSHTATYSSVSRELNISIQTVINTFDKYVYPSRVKLPSIICIDEIYTNKLTNRKYSCIMMDFETGKLIDVLPTRLKLELADRLGKIDKKERENVKYVVIDMWDPYNDVAKKVFYNAKVAVDSFHVITHLITAIDLIRLEVMRNYGKRHSKLENAPMYYYMLKKFHYFFTKNFDNIYSGPIKVNKMKTKWDKYEIRKYLFYIDDILMKAYELKEQYQEFNKTANYDKCEEKLNELINKFINFPHEAYNTFGNLLKHWKEQIINSFIRINGTRLSNGKMEGLNSRLKCLIKNANGFKDFD